MTNHPYPPPPRRLERSTDDRVIGGVCSGIARYLNLDPTLVRLLVAVLTLTMGFPIVLYLVALFLMPEEGDPRRQQPPPVGGPPAYNPYPYQSGQSTPEPDYAPGPGPSGPRQYGVPPTPGDQAVWGPAGAPWQQPPPPAPAPPPAGPNDPPAGKP